MTISDIKAMYDRYYEHLEWYENQLSKNTLTQEIRDDYMGKIKNLQIKVFNVGRQMEEAMDKAYIENIKQ